VISTPCAFAAVVPQTMHARTAITATNDDRFGVLTAQQQSAGR